MRVFVLYLRSLIFLTSCLRFYCTNQYDVQLNKVEEQNSLRKPKINFVMYFTDAVQTHSTFAYKINEAYARFMNLSIVLVKENDDNNFDVEDVRWNKVKILLNLLNDPAESDVDYWIWLDSDLVFVNFTFNISILIKQYENFDIILSREINPANGVANTGSIIVKNSEWSQKFFQSWWYDFDHVSAMDQHSFEELYSKFANRILLLPETAINSEFPGLWKHRDDLPILHLAGESNFIRAAILQRIWENYLDHFETTRPLITRAELDSIDYFLAHLNEWRLIASDLQHQSSSGHDFSLEHLQMFRYRMREAHQSLNKYALHTIPALSQTQSSSSLNRDDYQNLIGDISLDSHRQIFALSIVAIKNLEKSRNFVSVLQNALDCGFELALVESDWKRHTALLIQLEEIIDRLRMLVPEDNFKYLNYYRFKISEFEAIHFDHSQLFDAAINSYQKAFDMWLMNAVTYNYFGNGNGLLTSYKEGVRTLKHLLGLYCWRKDSPLIDYANLSRIIFGANCLLFSLLKESRNHIFPNSLSMTNCSTFRETTFILNSWTNFPFGSFSDYSQHEFYEILLLSLPCLVEERVVSPLNAELWKNYLLGESSNSLDFNLFTLSYFDLVTEEMLTTSLAYFRQIFQTSTKKRFKRKRKEL